MRSAVSRRAVAAGLPIAALAVGASTTSIAATDKPDAELLRLGAALSGAWARQARVEAELNAKLESDDSLWSRFDRLFKETGGIVDKIEALQATTLAGLAVKAQACHWCHSGEPIDAEFFAPDGKPTTDQRLAAGILGDLVALGGAHA